MFVILLIPNTEGLSHAAFEYTNQCSVHMIKGKGNEERRSEVASRLAMKYFSPFP